MMDKIASKLEFLFDSVESSLPEQNARWIKEALEANERGLALEYILDYSIPVDNDFREAARCCGDQMRIDVERSCKPDPAIPSKETLLQAGGYASQACA
jgi:hypothetical protein